MIGVQVLLLCGLAAAQSTFSPLRPPSIPLAVRSPYLSTWQQAGSDNGNGGYLPGQWPTFWFGAVTGWTGYIRVDNITYTWMGQPNVTNETNYYAIQTGVEYTSTQTKFTLNVAGTVSMDVTFLSPVLPSTILEMSLPYAYMDVAIHSIDGKRHRVQLYTDISAEWVDGDRNAIAQWSYGTANKKPQPNSVPLAASPASSASGPFGTVVNYQLEPAPPTGPHPIMASGQGSKPTAAPTSPPLNAVKYSQERLMANSRPGGVAYHKVWTQNQNEFHEFAQQAQWGYWYYATSNVKNLTHQQDNDVIVRTQFINNGVLENSQNNTFRAISDDYPTFAFANDLGSVGPGTASKTQTFQISLHQKNCIQFEEAIGNRSVPCMWTNYFNSDVAAVEYFYEQYDNILAQSQAVDNKVQSDSVAAAGQNYASLTSLSVRQAWGALTYTNSPSQPWVFLKEISSDGDVQTVDVIFPFHPILIYFNPEILRWILDPLFINQEAGYVSPSAKARPPASIQAILINLLWPYAFSIHDLGLFPNATGYNNLLVSVEQQPVEECGNMILMALAYAQRTGNNQWLAQHYAILRQWNDFLVNDTLIPAGQLSTDDFLGIVTNDTNLALKGIVAIESMAQISNRTGHTADGVNFTKIAHNYTTQWMGYGIDTTARPPHTTTSYGDNGTYSVLYNLYPDAMLGLHLVPKSVYSMQSVFYPTVVQRYGIALRSNTTVAKADWELWAAAIASPSTQQQIIGVLAEWLDQTTTNFAFTDRYNVTSGDFDGMFIDRPVVGGMFSILALQSAPKSGTVQPISSDSNQ